MGRMIVSLALASFLCIVPCRNLIAQADVSPDVPPAGEQPGGQGPAGEQAGGQEPAGEGTADLDQKEPAGAADESQASSLTDEEVDALMTNPDFSFRVNVCVADKQHPSQIVLNMNVREDGYAELLYVEPAPLADVFLCLAGAVSSLKFRAPGKNTRLKYLYSLAEVSPFATQSLWGSEKPKHEMAASSKGRKGGFGIYGALIPIDRGVNKQDSPYSNFVDTYWYVQFAGGFGLFGEFLVAPFMALGLELFFAFPRVEEVQKTGDQKQTCEDCQQDYLLDLVLRSKFIIRVAKKISLYPLLLFGYSDYISRAAGREAYAFNGIAFGAGAGIEGYVGARGG